VGLVRLQADATLGLQIPETGAKRPAEAAVIAEKQPGRFPAESVIHLVKKSYDVFVSS